MCLFCETFTAKLKIKRENKHLLPDMSLKYEIRSAESEKNCESTNNCDIIHIYISDCNKHLGVKYFLECWL